MICKFSLALIQSVMPDSKNQLTSILNSVRDDSESIRKVLPLVYDDLRNLAHQQLRRERPDHTINTTALVHEAYMKLVKFPPEGDWDGRRHFFGVAARAMRQILVNYAKKRTRKKRGGNSEPVEFDEGFYMTGKRADELIALDEALSRLEQMNERQGRIVECRYFAGYKVSETADILGISPATVKRDWTSAKAWLYNELKGKN